MKQKGLANVPDDVIRAAIDRLTSDEDRKIALMEIARESWLAGWDTCDAAYREALAPFGIELTLTTKGLD